MEGAFGVVVLAVREGPGAGLLHAARAALASGATEVVVVVGSKAAWRRLRALPVRAVVARGGRGDSVAAGVAALGPHVGSVVVTLANRVRVAPSHLRALASSLSHAKTVVASSYDGVVGAPAAFARSEFPRLLRLSGEEGASGLLDGAATLVLAGGNVRAIRPSSGSAPILLATHHGDPSYGRQVSRGPPVWA